MLVKFAVKNYRGFADWMVWDLSRSRDYEFNSSAIKEGVVKDGILYGPNGSGKTNLGMAMFDIVNHLTQKFKKQDYYNNFIYAGNPDGLVEFVYTFRFGRQTIAYEYAKSKDVKLVKEKLTVDGAVVFDHHDTTLDIDSSSFPMEPAFKGNIAQNANNVSLVNVLLSSFPLKSDHYLLKLRDFVNGMLWFRNLDVREFIGLETSVFTLDEYIIKNGLIGDFEEFLHEVSGQEFTFVQPDSGDKNLRCVYGGNTVMFDKIASTGTHALLLLYFWIQRVGKASLVFIDEFDAFYHFDLSFAVCKRLFALDAQVYLSTHNTYLMSNDLLRPDCNFILNGNEVKPLCECTDKELRLGHNIEKLYRGHTFRI